VQALDEVPLQPGRALGREGRDDDLVDPLVVDRLHRGGVGIWMRHLAVRVDAFAAQHRKRSAQTALGLRVFRAARITLRADDQEAGRPTSGALTDSIEERVAEARELYETLDRKFEEAIAARRAAETARDGVFAGPSPIPPPPAPNANVAAVLEAAGCKIGIIVLAIDRGGAEHLREAGYWVKSVVEVRPGH